MNGFRAKAERSSRARASWRHSSRRRRRRRPSARKITMPKGTTYLVYNADHPNTYAISGMTNGTTGDYVDLICYSGDKTSYAAQNVAVHANGAFPCPRPGRSGEHVRGSATAHAVPAGTTPTNPSAYEGPRLLVGHKENKTSAGGPNDGVLKDYYLYFQQLDGANDYDSLGGCGIDDGYLLTPGDSLGTVTWYCNAALFNSNGHPGHARRPRSMGTTPTRRKARTSSTPKRRRASRR